MATLRNKRKLAAVKKETQEEHPRNGQSRNTSVPRINEEYITQVSEEIESRVTEKLSQEFSRAESRILGALYKLDEFLLKPQITTHSETVPGTFRNTNVENQGTNEDDSQSDPHPEAGIFCGQTTQNSDLEECCDNVLLGVVTTKPPTSCIHSNETLRLLHVFRTIPLHKHEKYMQNTHEPKIVRDTPFWRQRFHSRSKWLLLLSYSIDANLKNSTLSVILTSRARLDPVTETVVVRNYTFWKS